MLRIDLHVHTIYSKDPNFPFLTDSSITLRDIEYQAKLKKIDGVAISDHNTLKGGVRFQKYVKEKSLDIITIPAEEIKTSSGDLIGLGITEEIKPKLSLGETLDLIRKYNGIAIVPHPCFLGIGENNLRTHKVGAVEVYNSNCPTKYNRKAEYIANELNLPKVGGSDAHKPKDIGANWTEINCDSNPESIIDAIKKGKCIAYGKNVSPVEAIYREVDRWLLKLLFNFKTYRKVCERI